MSSRRLAIALALLALPALALAHCQVPCGIYDDASRIQRLREDAATIAKATRNVAELAGKTDAQSANQLARWVATKEQHASQVIEVVAEYFLAQKLKPVADDDLARGEYLRQLAIHHRVIVAAMKTKQGAEPGRVGELEAAVEALAGIYPG